MAHTPPLAPTTLAGRYAEARRYDASRFTYQPPSTESAARLRTLVAGLVGDLSKGHSPQSRTDEARAAGFELSSMDGLWLLTEAGPKAGGGFYVFRPGGKPGCVQAPHTFFDEGTGDLALAVFEQLQLSCLFTNTVHRKAVSSPGASADVAHEASSLFNAATLGLMDASDGPVFQLHGFGSSTAPSGVEAIVSEGRPAPAAESLAARFRSALQTELGGDVRLFDVDVKVLGATTNVQGEAVRAANRAFMHVELSAPTRKRLLKDPQPLLRALSKVMPR